MGFTPNHQDVRMPEEAYGRCRRRDCKRIGELADGLCIIHWDMSTDRQVKLELNGGAGCLKD